MTGIEFYGEIVLPFLFLMAMVALAIHAIVVTTERGRNGRR